MKLIKSILLAAAFAVSTGSTALAEQGQLLNELQQILDQVEELSEKFDKDTADGRPINLGKGGLGFIDPMGCGDWGGIVPPSPIPEICNQYSMGHKVFNVPGYGMWCVTPMLNATLASMYAACFDCEDENELIDLFLIDLPMPPVADCPAEPLSDYVQRLEQHLADDGEFDAQETERRVDCHHGKKALGQPPEGQSRGDYIESVIETWMIDILGGLGSDDTLNELMDLDARLLSSLGSCKLRNCNGLDQCKAVSDNILVDLLEKGIVDDMLERDIDFDLGDFESIAEARKRADQLMENALNR